jgi:methylase of polypeptide subunit release factors
VATDVNPRAVRNARLNMERLGLGHIVDVRGPAHLFDAVAGERFDVILFNAPWNPGTPETIYDTATHDPGYRVLDAFLDQAPDHLTSGGLILLQHSDIARRTGGDSLAHLDAALRRRRLRVASRREMSRQSRLAGGQERVYLFEIRSAPPASPSSS